MSVRLLHVCSYWSYEQALIRLPFTSTDDTFHCHFKPKHSHTHGCMCDHVEAGCTVFFHRVLNVFVVAVPHMGDGYVHVQWGLSLHMFSTGVALCRLYTSRFNILSIHIWNKWQQLKGISWNLMNWGGGGGYFWIVADSLWLQQGKRGDCPATL